MESKYDFLKGDDSRLKLTIFVICLICIMGILAAHWASLTSVYQTLTGSLLGALGLHGAGAVGSQYTSNKHAVAMAAVEANSSDDSDPQLSDEPWNGAAHTGPQIGESAAV